MNLLRRAISPQHFLSSSYSPRRCPFFLFPRCAVAFQQISLYSITASYSSTNHTLKAQQPKRPRTSKSSPSLSWSQRVKKEADTSPTWPRPSEIPYQAKVANSVNFIGRIQMSIQFHATPDGKHMAATVVAQENGTFGGTSLNSLLIPVVFEGDLAHIVACHVKRNDCVYVTGKLCVDPLPFSLTESQGKFYVIGNEINFVQGFESHKSDLVEMNVGSDDLLKELVGALKSNLDEDTAVSGLWEDLLGNPNQWWVITSQDDGLKGAIEGFERKVDGKRLDLDESTPVWVYKKLEELNFDNKIEEKNIEQITIERKTSKNSGGPKDGDSVSNSWRDLVNNTNDWWDYRERKSNGLVKANHPDFKHKTNGAALWLNKAPGWVLQGLQGLEFNVVAAQVQDGQRANGGKGKNEDSWKNLVENPNKWWDNRSRKTNVRAPDFKHKETGEALWLNSSPEWVLSKLPPLKDAQNIDAAKKQAYAG